MLRRYMLLALALLALPAADGLVQGWTVTEREIWWNAPVGSRVIPFAWFAQLGSGPGLFAAPERLAAYGFIAGPGGGLPIGLSRERSRADGLWLGVTCAACHVREIRRGGASVLIEGAGAMLDLVAFDRDLSAALAETAGDEGRFAAFADRLGTAEAARPALRARLEAVASERGAATRRNASTPKPGHEPGPGRIDLAGIAVNTVRPEGARAPDAPVRFPALWGAAGYDRAFYAGGVSNAGAGALVRNVVQVLGAYGTPDSVDVVALQAMEALLRRLEAPAWPVEVLGPIDAGLARQGAAVFAGACAGCHAPAGRDGRGLLGLTRVPLGRLGTDGSVGRGPGWEGVVGVAMGIVARSSRGRGGVEVVGDGLATVRAAPLAGVWAGAPYLHDGSVASLRELLTAPERRAGRFVPGGAYDPGVVGYAVPDGAGVVREKGGGHAYGTALPEGETAALLEYLKTL